MVELFSDGTLVRTWARIERGRQTNPADYPPEKVAFFMRTPVWCRRRAAEIGPSVVQVVAELLSVNALHRLRSAQGVVGLAERYAPARVDLACQRALEVGDPSYRTIRGILVAGTEAEDNAEGTVPSSPAHLHGPSRLFEPSGEAS